MLNQIVRFTVKPEQTEAFKAALIADKRGAQTEAGCVEMRFFSQNDQPNVIFAYERFVNQAALEHHATQPYVTEVFKLAKTALANAPQTLKLGETRPAPDHSRTAGADDDVFVIFFIFKVKPAYRQRVLDQFETHIAHTNEEPGNILFDLYTVDGDDEQMVVYEHWRSAHDVWEVHMKQPYAEETGALLAEAVDGELADFMSFVTEFG